MDLVEEAVHLLRRAPGGTLAGYYLGALPFVLGTLYFWTDMSRSPFAVHHLAGGALGVTMLFLWMKFWQTVFAANLRAQIAGVAPPRWNWRRCARTLIFQTALQPTALLLQSASILFVIPAPWIYALYQNITVFGDGESPEVLPVWRRAWRQAFLWPGQNLVMLAILAAFGFFVFLNLLIVSFTLPGLLKSLLGIDSIYAQSPRSLLNTTFFAALAGITYLCVDPIVKSLFTLRCFYGESLKSGEDLKAELKSFARPAKAAATALLLFGAIGTVADSRAADDTTAPPPSASADAGGSKISAPQLDKTIDGVIHESKYAWRLPRGKMTDDDTNAEGPLGRFFDRVWSAIKGWIKSAWDWLQDFMDRWLRRRSPGGGSAGGRNWIGVSQALLYVLLVVVVCALVIFIMRAWWQRQRRPAMAAAAAISVPPDLTDENTGAEQLPEDGWMQLGRELLERGDYRLALRAFYFASLAHLAARGLITIARFKSNREYELELRRRGHSLPELLASFGENVLVFDRSWYGLRDVGPETVSQFFSNVERIKSI